MKWKQFLFLLFGLFSALLALTRPIFAQGGTPTDDEVNRIARQLYCPVCENTPLDVCPTEACRQWRELIRQMLAEGKSEEEIKQYFVEHYGARVLSEPPRQGFNWLVYLAPPLLILSGAILLFRTMRNWVKIAAVEAEEIQELSDDPLARRLEEDLRKRGS
ncbi:MAG: cytochrome c-type biogenesis protein CcmH [Anaerolineales bacterium]